MIKLIVGGYDVNEWLNMLAGGGSAMIVWGIGNILIDNWKKNRKVKKK
ncbi:MAG: hypothetical protein WBG30_06890 [Psychrilyobacter sp.]